MVTPLVFLYKLY